jgi:hypothetical protein
MNAPSGTIRMSEVWGSETYSSRFTKLKIQAGGDQKIFDELWQKELTIRRDKARERTAEQEINNRFNRAVARMAAKPRFTDH